jgi:hypothetical protein
MYHARFWGGNAVLPAKKFAGTAAPGGAGRAWGDSFAAIGCSGWRGWRGWRWPALGRLS